MARTPLKPVCITGLILALILSWSMVLFGLILRRDVPVKGSYSENSFTRELREYDLFDGPKRALEGEEIQQIEKRLSRLQKQARGVEEQLSVLKRRRVLALLDRRYINAYEKAAHEAAEAFAHSVPIAAVAAEAAVLGADGAQALLKNYAGRLSQNRFGSLELSVHVLAGNLEDPATAAALPGLETLLSRDFACPPQTRINLLADEFLLRALKGDIPGASARLSFLIAEAPHDTGLQRMGAEFFYDHNNPLKAADLFSRLAASGKSDGERDIARAADALVLAGEIPGARNIWLALSSPDNAAANERPGDGFSGQIRYRSLYNLAASSADSQEKLSWIEKLLSFRSQRGLAMDSTGIYSIIRYTRLLDTPRSIAVLNELVLNERRKIPLLDLELLRRRLDTLPPNRAAAEVWLLLGRQSEDEDIYEWAAWYFDHQRLYGETARLLKEAARKRMSGPWIDLHRSLALIREGKTSEGEKILLYLSEKEAGPLSWEIFANLGRIREGRRAVPAALEAYQSAAALVADKAAAAQVQIRISRCLEALDRIRESRNAMEYALELDGENLNIRRELRRLNKGY